MLSRGRVVLLAGLFASCSAFSPIVPHRSAVGVLPTTALRVKAVDGAEETSSASSSASSSSTADKTWTVQRCVSDGSMYDVASFRNNLESPEMLIERQQAKRDAQDNTGAAAKGAGIGVALGAVYGGFTFMQGGSVQDSLINFAVPAVLLGGVLAFNSLSGNNVYVFPLDDAKNRLKVDFAEGIFKKQDVGFVARLNVDGTTVLDGRYSGTNGVIACIDCQLRNCEESQNPRVYGILPPHVHIRNLSVDKKQRRKGIARDLVQEVEAYARTTDAEIVTLVVDDDNFSAVNLYKSLGYEMESIGSPTAQPRFGQWTKGRSIMTKIF